MCACEIMVGHLQQAFAQINVVFGVVLVTTVCGTVHTSMVFCKDLMCKYRYVSNLKGSIQKGVHV